MPLWSADDQANGVPKWAADSFDAGSGSAAKVTATQALYGNTTAGAYIANQTDTVLFVTTDMISNGSVQASGGPGWYIKRTGAGGRAGRTTYEQLVAFSRNGSSLAARYIWNLKPSNTTRIRAAYQANTRNVRIAISGDSTTKGVDETSVPYNAQYANNAMPVQLAAKLNSSGIISASQNFFGLSGTSFTDYMNRDARCAATGNTSFNVSSVPVWGGAEVEFPNTGASTFSFTTPGNATKADIYYQDSAAGRTFSWAVDGGAATNVNTTGVNTIVKLTVSLGAAAVHTLQLAWVAGFVRIYGIDCYDDSNSRKEVSIWNWGISGGTSSDMILNTGTPSSGRLQQLALYPPDLFICEMGLVNSWRNSRTIANCITDMTTFVTSVKAANSDVMFLTPPYDSGATGNTAQQDQYVAAMYQVALAQDIPVIDIRQKWGSYANSVAHGYQANTDAVHPAKIGYADETNVVFNAVRYALRGY